MKSKIHWIHSAVVILLPLYHIKLFPVYTPVGGNAALVELAAPVALVVPAITGAVATTAAAVAASAPVVLVASCELDNEKII